MADERYQRRMERIIAAHRQALPELPPDRRPELIARWERWRGGGESEPVVEKALELAMKGNLNERELGFHVLMDLAILEPPLRVHVRRLAGHRSAEVRRGVATHLSRELPAEFRNSVYGALLQDKVPSVRRRAIKTIGMRYLADLLPELRALRSTEQDGKVVEGLDFWIPLLENGYRVDPYSTPDTFWVMVLTGDGTASKLVKSADPHDPKILEAVEELKRRGRD